MMKFRRAVAVEVLALFVGLAGTVISATKLNEASGLSFLGDGGQTGRSEISFAHNCSHELGVYASVSPFVDYYEIHEPIGFGTGFSRIVSGKPVKAFDANFRLALEGYRTVGGLKFVENKLDCNYLAIDIGDERLRLYKDVREDSFRVTRQWLEPLANPSALDLKGDGELIDAIINFGYHDFSEGFGFVWHGFYRNLGDFKVGVGLSQSNRLKSFDVDSSGVTALFVEVSSPADYRIVSETPDPSKVSFVDVISGETYNGDFAFLGNSNRSTVVFEAETADDLKEGRLILFSTLLGLFFGLLVESIFAVLRSAFRS